MGHRTLARTGCVIFDAFAIPTLYEVLKSAVCCTVIIFLKSFNFGTYVCMSVKPYKFIGNIAIKDLHGKIVLICEQLLNSSLLKKKN